MVKVSTLSLDLVKLSLTPRKLVKRGIFSPTPTFQEREIKFFLILIGASAPFVPRWCLTAHLGVTKGLWSTVILFCHTIEPNAKYLQSSLQEYGKYMMHQRCNPLKHRITVIEMIPSLTQSLKWLCCDEVTIKKVIWFEMVGWCVNEKTIKTIYFMDYLDRVIQKQAATVIPSGRHL